MGQATESDCYFRVRTREERVDIQHFNERLDYPNSKRAVRNQAERFRPARPDRKPSGQPFRNWSDKSVGRRETI